jgi:hypothetical protein
LRKIATRSPLFEGKREDFEGLKKKIRKRRSTGAVFLHLSSLYVKI